MSDDEMIAIAQEIQKSDAIRFEARIETLLMSYFVFDRNYGALRKLMSIRTNVKKMLELWDLRNRSQLATVINEVLRLFQNYLSSAKSLVDQTRVIIRASYKNTDFLKEYEEQVASRFVKNPVSGFIEDLRNYNLHYALPITHATLSIGPNDASGNQTINFSFVLIKASLLVWKEWKKGKTFLAKSDDQIDISDLADEYYKQIAEFHSWLVSRLQEIHQEELVWLDVMRQKMINALSDEERKERGLA